MNPALSDERQADKAIIASLIKTNRILWEELEHKRSVVQSEQIANTRSFSMSKLLQDVSGVLYMAHQCEELAVGDAQRLLESLRSDAARLEAWLAEKMEQAAGVQEEQPASVDPAAPPPLQ